MKKHRGQLFAFLICVVAGLCACSPDDDDGLDGVDLGDAGAEDRDAGDGDPSEGKLDREPSAYAVVAGDYTVTSISLLAPDGTIKQPDFVNSGSATAGLVTALSGDVVLPTRSGERGVLTLIDRFRSNVITRIDIAKGAVLGQVRTQAANTEDDENGFSSNPQDYVQIDADTAWVSRYEPNLTAGEDDPDKSIDLLRIDPKAFQRSHERIDFGVFNSTAERTNADTGETEEVTAYARPLRIVRLGGHLVVGLESLSNTFDAAGEGMVALVDLETSQVEKLELPGLQSCGQVVPVPDDPTRVAVACTGVFFGDAPSTAGLAMLQLDDGELSIEHIWHVSEHAGQEENAAETRYGLVALNATEVVAVAAGDSEADTNDKAYVVDLASGEQTELFEADGQYVLGDGAFNPRKHILLLPDASADAEGKPTGGIRRFERAANGTFSPLDSVEVDPILPPLEIKPID